MRTPRNVDVEITARCNLRCRYCYFFDNPGVTYQDLPAEPWLRFFAELGRCAVMTVTLSGGEPFVRKDLPELLEGIVRNRMRFAILSNGALINDTVAAFIAGTGRCDYVQVSLDGSRPETHDTMRGSGSFEGATRGIRILQRHQVPVTVRVTIHRHNVHDLEDTARLLLEELGLDEFTTNAASYIGSCRQYSNETLLSVPERQLAMQTLLRISQKYEGRISAMAGPLEEARRWLTMVRAQHGRQEAFADGGHLTACGCPSQSITVRADGGIVPCTMLAHLELGRINEDSLQQVWQHSPALNRLRQRRSIPLTEFDFCQGCPYVRYCTGNCPAMAYTLTGLVDHPAPDACLRQFLAAGGRLPDAELLGCENL